MRLLQGGCSNASNEAAYLSECTAFDKPPASNGGYNAVLNRRPAEVLCTHCNMPRLVARFHVGTAAAVGGVAVIAVALLARVLLGNEQSIV